MNENPFVKYEDILLRGGYGTAQHLQALVANMYNGSNSVEMGRLARNADKNHLSIAINLILWYAAYGEGDPEFMRIAGELHYRNRARKKTNKHIG